MMIDDVIQSLENRPAAYVLESADGSYRYKGSSRELKTRIEQHLTGHVSRTKNRRPLSLLHYEYFESYSDAVKREFYFKSGAGREWLKRRYG